MTLMLSYLSNFANSQFPALANHLWQSTLFAVAAGLLTLTLRKQAAQIRYAVWLAASLKFLVPFSLLVLIGNWVSPAHSLAAGNTRFYVVEQMTEPFTQPVSPVRAAAITASKSVVLPDWQALLLIVWPCGGVAVLAIWLVRWWKVSAARRNAALLSDGKEAATLRRLSADLHIPVKVDILLSLTSLEPGVFGIFRPVLLWPKSISEKLEDSQLEAVLAHELCHVRRQDNLAAALHMLVESIFWFHPLVWWVGARLIEEREQACDEAVIEMGSGRHVYAESILKVCEFCLSSPLTCVSGVTGSDLKKRMVHIMTDRIAHKLNFTRKLLLWTAACFALAVPIIYGLLNPTPGRADSEIGTAVKYANVSVKPHPEDANGMNRTTMMVSLDDASFIANGVSAQRLIQLAYHIQDTQLVEVPNWLASAKYDINAKLDKAAADQVQKLTQDERAALGQRMLQGLLADQFKLKLHEETRDLPVYELTVAEGGSKLQKGAERGFMQLGMGELSSNGAPLELLTAQLGMRLGRTVVDKTGLKGNYAFTLQWTPDSEEEARLHAANEPVPPAGVSFDTSAPPLMTAIQDQLGLTLQPQTDRVQVLVIDHIEQPAQE